MDWALFIYSFKRYFELPMCKALFNLQFVGEQLATCRAEDGVDVSCSLWIGEEPFR